MKDRTQLSLKLYDEMLRSGYPQEFCEIITLNLKTDFTAKRMLGYLKNTGHPSLEDVTDEMLAILSDRAAIMQKKEMESVQASLNQMMAEGFGEDE